ncbi:MAG: MGMT family protein, partial [Deltaproteobacteria bacterium]|nr:MGMT family protein [Deltaproteobacteria bacterium]
TLSYSQLARMVGSPRAQRAVGSALAANSIAFLIPCHRIIRKNGTPGNYRGGNKRKLAILAWESGRSRINT